MSKETLKYSVLMSVHAGEQPAFLKEALASISAQSVIPTEFVLVEDGPITPGLETVIVQFEPPFPFHRIKLPRNSGLGIALQAGLERCRHPIIARMDADDIAVPDRMAMQLDFLEKNPHISAVGGAIAEFDDSPNDIVATRRTPTDPLLIGKYAKLRNPMNHQTVTFRKDAIDQVGGYQHMPGFEDYFLWVRLLLANFQLANVDDIVVKARRGNNLFFRRRGQSYFRNELRFLAALKRSGFLSQWEYIKAVVLRTPVRLVPSGVVKLVYNQVLRS